MASCSSPVMETPLPNWLELHTDITINILQRLDTLDIVTSASVVCPLWWNICKDPSLWSTIDMVSNVSLSHCQTAYSSRLEKICRYAVDRSSGYLKDIYINKFATGDLLNHIAMSTNELRCIKLQECHGISKHVFSELVEKQPFLEELDIADCSSIGTEFFEYIGQCCPLLKSLKFSPLFEEHDKCDDIAFAIAKTMSMLRHLTILNNGLTNDGLLAILDGCPLLESLDLRGCRHLDLEGSLGKRCNEQIKELRFSTESVVLKSSCIVASCSSLVMETPKPNWIELPRDITINILQRLDTVEIVTSACIVCPLWWNICKDPRLWRTIDMVSNVFLSYSDVAIFCRLEKICRYAVDRSSGQLKDIYIKIFGTDVLLLHIANSASHLRCLRLEGCHEISSEVLEHVVKKQPLLEELGIHSCNSIGTSFFHYIGKCCPLLTSLKFSPCYSYEELDKDDNVAFIVAKTMPQLRHLMILNNEITNDGLLAILDGCPLLESLDVRGCLHLKLDGSLQKRCIEQIREFRFSTDSVYPGYCYRYGDYIHSLRAESISSRFIDNSQIILLD